MPVRRLVRAFRAAADGRTAEMPAAARNQPGDGDMAAADMAAADAAVRGALQARSGVVLDQWLERIARPCDGRTRRTAGSRTSPPPSRRPGR